MAARLLRLYPSTDTKLVSLNEILLAPRWMHLLIGSQTESTLTLHDGTTIHGDEIGVVFNRLQYVDMPHFAASAAEDREYAIMEMFALLLSWLKALRCPIVSRVSPKSLGGPTHSVLAWQYLAAKAGLPTARLRLTSSLRRYSVPGLVVHPVSHEQTGNIPAWLVEPMGQQTLSVMVVGERVIGAVPAELVAACIKLASLSGIDVLLIHFATTLDGGAWRFNGVDTHPAASDESAVEAIVNLLEARS
ncbi:MAG TPA: hypothetical protein VGN90_07480 [Pyrinomonadaceae bacterium]|nr:hypothetical protein [Pyrinomonadaceae bacterium]